MTGPGFSWEGSPLLHQGSLEIVVDSSLAAEFPRIYWDLKPYWDAIARYIS